MIHDAGESLLWQYFRLEIPIWLWSLAEVSLLVPFALALMPWARYWVPWQMMAYVLCLMLLPFYLIRLMTLLGLSLTDQRRFLLLGLLTVLIISVRNLLYEPDGLFDITWLRQLFTHLTASGYPFWARDLGLIGLVLYSWWRGMTLYERPTSLGWIGLQFRVRALLIAPFIIYLASRRLIIDMTPFLLLFGFAQLLVVAFARANDVQRQATGLAFQLQPRWILVVGGAALGVVTVSGLGGYAASSSSVAGPPQRAAGFLAASIFFSLALMLAPILFPLFEWLAGILIIALQPVARLLSNFSGISIPQPEPIELEPVEQAGIIAQYISFLPSIVFLLILAILIGAIIILYQRVIQPQTLAASGGRIKRQTSADPDGGGGLWDRLREILPGWQEWRAARSIRRIYRQMVFTATHQGVPREVAQTPFEYLERLEEVWPDGRPETTLITQAYVRIRYGQLPETREELADIVNAWRRLEDQLMVEN